MEFAHCARAKTQWIYKILHFREVNKISQFDTYPLPRVDEMVERLGRAKYISTLDLCKGYWQVPPC